MDLELIALIAGLVLLLVVVVVPALALTARFTLKPVVDAVLRMQAGSGASRRLERRILELEEGVRSLRETVHELEEAEAFHSRVIEQPRAKDRTTPDISVGEGYSSR